MDKSVCMYLLVLAHGSQVLQNKDLFGYERWRVNLYVSDHVPLELCPGRVAGFWHSYKSQLMRNIIVEVLYKPLMVGLAPGGVAFSMSSFIRFGFFAANNTCTKRQLFFALGGWPLANQRLTSNFYLSLQEGISDQPPISTKVVMQNYFQKI